MEKKASELPPVIAITGCKNAGKDTLAGYLCRETKYGYQQQAFASPLKDGVAALFGWPRNMVEGATPESRAWREQPDTQLSAALGMRYTPRKALEDIGKGIRDIVHPDIFLQLALMRWYKGSKQRTVFTDARYPNECAALKEATGRKSLQVNIRRHPLPEWYETAMYYPERMPEAYPDVPETEWKHVALPHDIIINNDGTLEDLFVAFDKALADWVQN